MLTREQVVRKIAAIFVIGNIPADHTQARSYLDPVLKNDEEQRQTIETQAQRIGELEDWQKIVIGSGTDQETVIRMAAAEYTKTAVQCWKNKVAELEAELARVKATMDPIDEECCNLQAKWKVEAQWAAEYILNAGFFNTITLAEHERAQRILDGKL